MKVVNMFECSICHAKFWNEDVAIACEQCHEKTKLDIKAKYNGQCVYPCIISIEFENGNVINYYNTAYGVKDA